jgi:hypothetical protein
MSKDQLSWIFHFKIIQNIFENWIFKKSTFLKFWRKKNTEAVHYIESFILGSEWDLIFLLCFVLQTIQNIFEIWIFKNLPF